MLVVYDFTNISEFKIIPAKSASKYGKSVDFSAIFLPNNDGELVYPSPNTWRRGGGEEDKQCVEVK